jgi:hypothetical protein
MSADSSKRDALASRFDFHLQKENSMSFASFHKYIYAWFSKKKVMKTPAEMNEIYFRMFAAP